MGALLLPVVDLLLLTAEHTLVVLVVVDLGVVGLNAVQEEVAVLLEEGVDAERQVVKVGAESGGLGEGAGLESAERGGKVGGRGGGWGLQLVDERSDQVRVVDLDGQLLEDILVAEIGLLQPVERQSAKIGHAFRPYRALITYSSELNLLSLKASMNLADRRKARRLRLP